MVMVLMLVYGFGVMCTQIIGNDPVYQVFASTSLSPLLSSPSPHCIAAAASLYLHPVHLSG